MSDLMTQLPFKCVPFALAGRVLLDL
jgi:hypothetical protein